MITLITHIFNEEYLLPFWLEHHKHIVSDGIIIDYNSTDNSLEIIKNICPTWRIIKSKNEDFNAELVDKEIMELENTINGYKLVLTTTEFLLTPRSLNNILPDISNNCISIPEVIPISLDNNYFPNNINEILENIESVVPGDNTVMVRYNRFMHSYDNGKYDVGRHKTSLSYTISTDLYILWLGFYPWNDIVIQRKLQIKSKIPQSDKNVQRGFHHLFDLEKLKDIKHQLENIMIDINTFPNLKECIDFSLKKEGGNYNKSTKKKRIKIISTMKNRRRRRKRSNTKKNKKSRNIFI